MRRSRLFLVVLLVAASGFLACSWQPRATLRPQTLPAAASAAAPAGTAEPWPLIPRQKIFGTVERQAGQISPDGEWLAFLAPADGVLNLHLARRDAPEEVRVLTRERERGIASFSFAFDRRHLLYSRDEGGDENFQVFALDIATGATRALTPRGAMALVEKLSPSVPGAVVVSVNDRDPEYFDLVRYELASGESRRLVENREFSAFLLDDALQPRLASRQTADGGKEWLLREGEAWRSWVRLGPEDAILSGLLHLAADGRTLYFFDSREHDTTALAAFDTATSEQRRLCQDQGADLELGLVQPRSGVVQAVVARGLRARWIALDSAIAGDLVYLEGLARGGELRVESRSLDDLFWVVSFESPRAGKELWLYDRTARAAKRWYAEDPQLASLPLAALHTAEIRSRDGLVLPAYYLLPPAADPDDDGVPAAPLPMVLRVHGGPWDRDRYGASGLNQWLANRGYAVLLVNFRGSTGFGKTFVNAGDHEWGGKMQDDLLDAVDWAVAHAITRPDKVAIQGASYGGYATLAALTTAPERFACGISVVGPSNLETLLASIPPYWQSTRRLFTQRVGDPDTEAGRRLLRERSPLHHVDQIRRPLLIAQGANDPRVKVAESEQIVAAMTARGLPVTYVLFPDEGHGFARPANELAFSAVVEEFLAGCLGGRAETVGSDFAGSSLTIPVGAELLPDTAKSLAAAGRAGG